MAGYDRERVRMKAQTIIIIVLSVLVAGTLAILSYMKILDGKVQFGAICLVIDYVAMWQLLLFMEDRLDKQDMEKEKLPYCFAKINELLGQLPGGDVLQWESGMDRRSQVRTFLAGKDRVRLRSIYALIFGKAQGVVVIYNIDSEDIFAYWANPSSEQINDPFKNVKPFDQMNQMNPMAMMGGKKYRNWMRNRGGLITYDDSADMYQPDEDFMGAVAPQQNKPKQNFEDVNE